jgi:hypothetical protein
LVAELRDIPITDYTNINNFILRVDGQVVTPDFSYNKLFEYKVTKDGEVVTVVEAIHITYESVVNVWNEVNSQMVWGCEMIDKNDFNWVSESFLNAFETTLNDFGLGENTNPDICGEKMKNIMYNAVINHGYIWLFKEDVEIKKNEIEYMKKIHLIFFNNQQEDIIVKIDQLLDEIIFSSMQVEQKMRLCIYGKSFIGLNNICNAIASKIDTGEIIIIDDGDDDDDDGGVVYTALSRTDFNYRSADSRPERMLLSCLTYKLAEVFENGNWVDKAEFVVSTPISFFWKTGSCLAEISAGRWDHVK